MKAAKNAEMPDPTRIEGAPHPRDTLRLYGQSRAEADFLHAYGTGRLHHGWLLTGPRGVGKATLAWQIAKFLLAHNEDDGALPDHRAASARTLATDPDAPANRRIHAGSEPAVFELKRGANATGTGLSRDIRVDEVRKLKSFLHLSAAEGGRRVVIIDSADDLNIQAANALLKLLEEPPERVTFLLVAHQPAQLLPTIRSRCRELRLASLLPEDMAQALGAAEALEPEVDTLALAALSAGSVGEAVRLLNLDGLDTYAKLVGVLAGLPRLDRPKVLAMADTVSGKQNETKFDLMLDLLDVFMARTARAGVTGPPLPEAAPNEAQLLSRLSPDPLAAMKWAALHHELGARARHGRSVNLDPAALVLDMVLSMTSAAR